MISRKFTTLVIIYLSVFFVQGFAKKSAEALRIDKQLVIDGILSEDCYKKAQPAKDFVQLQPYNGQRSMKESEVYFFYEENALYVGAMLYDNPDSIYNYLSQRDDIGTADYFGVYFDPFNQGQLAYGFFITPAGVQVDIKASKTSDGDKEDGNWNAVWESKTRITENGWTVEMRIPWSALRFPAEQSKTWGLNMFRNLRRFNSNNSWNFIDRKMTSFLNQAGELTGIENVKPPFRLSLTPYLATYFEPANSQSKAGFIYKGGLDLKYGINESFTLDMMVIPDFGQIQSDDKKLNLTPFELYYNEKRQFFTEGTELFNKADIFYSRRIGGSPKFSSDIETSGNEKITYNPSETQLLNATKITGRTNKNLGIGFLNAMSLPSYAIIENNTSGNNRKISTQPFTNYNVIVLDKSLPNNSYVSLINTNLSMISHPFKANVTGAEFQIMEKTKTYALSGKGAFSTRGDSIMQNGYYAIVSLEKKKGKIFYGLNEKIYSDNYNPNDLGYLHHNNQVTTEAWLYSQIIEPFWIFREVNGDIWWNYNRMYKPSTLYDNETGIDLNARFKNNYFLALSATYNTEKYDYYEPRVANRFYLSPYFYYLKTSLQSDSRKPLFFILNYSYAYQPEIKCIMNTGSVEARCRIGQKLTFSYESERSALLNDRGFAGFGTSNNEIFFSQRNVNNYINTFESAYVFNNKTGINLRARHYCSLVENNNIYTLNSDGTLEGYSGIPNITDQNFNYLTVDLIFRWIFAPGSEMSLAWKTLSYSNEDTVDYNYFSNLNKSWQNQQHSISLKILYYFDYMKFFSKKTK